MTPDNRLTQRIRAGVMRERARLAVVERISHQSAEPANTPATSPIRHGRAESGHESCPAAVGNAVADDQHTNRPDRSRDRESQQKASYQQYSVHTSSRKKKKPTRRRPGGL